MIYYLNAVPKKIDPGIYLAAYMHIGFYFLSRVSFFSVSGYQDEVLGHENKFYPTINLTCTEEVNSESPYILLFNPVSCEVKTKGDYTIKFLFIKFEL